MEGKTKTPFLSLLSILTIIATVTQPIYAQSSAIFACDTSKTPEAANFGFCNKSLEIDYRVQDLISRLSIDEKVGFLASKNPSVSRLGIPSYEWWSEALHGVSYVGPGTHFNGVVPGATSFPQVIHSAASFNTSLFYAMGTVVSTEARAMYNLGLAGLTFWSPNVNIFRDPRWGRGQETPGEDPLLVSLYAVNYVRGLQTADDPAALKVAACCKHYTAYDVDNWKGVQRYSFNALVTKQDMDDTYQPPFKSCVVDGNVASVMCSYNQVNGVPTCADPALLAGIVREDWNLNGYIVSDCDSVEVLYNAQHYTKSPEEAAAKAILAGLDLNCGSFLGQHTKAAVVNGLLKESDIDRAISHNFATLMRLGFYDGDPAKGPYGGLGVKDVCSPEHQQLAADAARQGVVLLKNLNGALPLSSAIIKTLAVIGPNANASKAMLGNYEGSPCHIVTPLQGLASLTTTYYQPGCSSVACTTAGLQLSPAKTVAAAADATVLIVGSDQSIERESLDRVSLTLPGQQEVLITEVAKAAKGPVVLVIMSGGPFDITFAKNNDRISAIIWIGFPGEKGGVAIADVIFGLYNPSGRLPVTWYPQAFADKVSMTDMNMRPNPATGYPGRSHRFYTGDVVYSFGDGLSYSQYEHTLIQGPPKTMTLGLELAGAVDLASDGCHGLGFEVKMRVTNSGRVSGGHTVMLFSTPPAGGGAPRRQLLGFNKVHLAPAQQREVAFQVNVCRDLSVVDEAGLRRVPLGAHLLHVGNLKHSLSISA